MKRLLLSLAIGLGSLTATSAMAATPVFNAQQMAKTKIPELNFKYIMRQFYSDRMVSVAYNYDDINSYPYIGLTGVDDQVLRTVGVMHPAIEYKNASGETRYLVLIEKLKVDEDDPDYLISCRICLTSADLYTFKQLDSGVYQLVSKSLPDNEIEISGGWGLIKFDSFNVKTGIQVIGKDLVGSIYKNNELVHGEDSYWWEALHLPEDDFIDIYHLGDGGLDISGVYGEDSPLSYKYNVVYKVLSDDNSKYYPIQMTYLGEMPNDDTGRIEDVHHSTVKRFDPVKKEYY